MRPLLVGENNRRSEDRRAALWPAPVNTVGWRLCYKILGMTRYAYVRRFERMNLCKRGWSVREARESVEVIRADHDGPVILLGRRVCEAFEVPYEPFSVQHSILGPERRLFVLPHPSWQGFAWNDPGSVDRVRKLLAEFL